LIKVRQIVTLPDMRGSVPPKTGWIPAFGLVAKVDPVRKTAFFSNRVEIASPLRFSQ
jgi:hypothetical protein